MTSGIFSNREKKGLNVDDIDISTMDSKNIILEIKNRLEFICNKTNVSKRKLSNILDKPDGYIAHRFSYNDKLNLTVIIDIIKIFNFSPDTLFLPKKEDFWAALSDTKISELKNNVQKAYKAIEIRQLKKEIDDIFKQLRKNKGITVHSRRKLLNRAMRKLKKLRKLAESKKLASKSADKIKRFDQLITKADTLIEQTEADLKALKN